MSILSKLAIGSLAAFALFRSKKPAAKQAARSEPVVAARPATVAKPRRKAAKRRATARPAKSA